MAKSIINLTDNIATWVNKSNITVNRVGDLATLSTTHDSSLVGSINELKGRVDLLDSSSAGGAFGVSVRSLFSATGDLTYDSSTGQFGFDVNDPTLTISGDAAGSATMTNLGNTTISVSLNANTVNSSELTSAVNLKIYNQAGSVVKNLYGSGS